MKKFEYLYIIGHETLWWISAHVEKAKQHVVKDVVYSCTWMSCCEEIDVLCNSNGVFDDCFLQSSVCKLESVCLFSKVSVTVEYNFCFIAQYTCVHCFGKIFVVQKCTETKFVIKWKLCQWSWSESLGVFENRPPPVPTQHLKI